MGKFMIETLLIILIIAIALSLVFLIVWVVIFYIKACCNNAKLIRKKDIKNKNKFFLFLFKGLAWFTKSIIKKWPDKDLKDETIYDFFKRIKADIAWMNKQKQFEYVIEELETKNFNSKLLLDFEGYARISEQDGLDQSTFTSVLIPMAIAILIGFGAVKLASQADKGFFGSLAALIFYAFLLGRIAAHKNRTSVIVITLEIYKRKKSLPKSL